MWNPPADLRQRWIAEDFQLEHVAMDAFRGGRLDRSGLGLYEGRVDMRAFDTPPSRAAGVLPGNRGGLLALQIQRHALVRLSFRRLHLRRRDQGIRVPVDR